MFHDNLIQLRKRNHMSQEELAAKIGIARQTLSKWETGESVPDIEKCALLAELFGVTLDDLVKYEIGSYFGLSVPPEGQACIWTCDRWRKGTDCYSGKGAEGVSHSGG